MSRARLVLLSLVAALSVVAMTASSASAKISFEWLVGSKKPLAAGESREFTATNDGKHILLVGKAGGQATVLLGTGLSVEKGAKIIGGKPGTNEEIVIFTGVKVVKPLFENQETCEAKSKGANAKEIKTNLLKTEIVESQENGEPLILFEPKSNANFVEIEFAEIAKECVIKGVTAAVTGSVLAAPLPALGDVLTADLDFEAPTKNFLLSGGALDTSGLLLGGKAANFTALALVTLVSDELYGIF